MKIRDNVEEILKPDFVPNEEAKAYYWSNSGNEVVHDVWSVLRDFEPTWKDSVISARPAGIVGSAWYYTKVVLRALFMNAPSTSSTAREDETRVDGDLKRAVDALAAAAAFDDPDAMFLLGEMNLHGNFSHPRDPRRAFEWYSKLAELDGNATAQYMLGLLHATGIGGAQKDQARSMLFHNFAAEQGHIRSEMTLGYRHHAGIGTSRDCNKAVNYYKRVADKVMNYRRSGPPGGNPFVRNSYRWVEADGGAYGEGASASSSGVNARQDGGFTSNIDDVLEYLSLKESSGDYGATFQLGKHYYEPPRGYKRNLRKAQRQFMKIARAYWTKDGKVNSKSPKGIEKTAGQAAAYIGRMFLRGEGMEQNFDKAKTWFNRGVSSGDAYAQYHLGIMYQEGFGVQKDGPRAATYFKTAAEQGLAVAQSATGILFLDQGDVETAGRYFELAASAGVTEAFYYLAELYNNGLGRDRNCHLATVYFKVVAERGEALHSAIVEANAAYERGDFERAFIPTMMAAEQGREHAQANAAYLLDHQTSVIKSSIPLLSSPAKSSSKLLKNPELALVYYTRSAKQANVDSLVKMGDYYLAGVSSTTEAEPAPVPSPSADTDKAVTCYTTAAEGHHSAQALWNLGWMHENGVGSVSQDFYMAKRYYDLAYEVNKEAYLPVKLALLKLRARSWWNGVSGGKVNPIRDNEDDKKGRPKSFMEWVNKFLDAALEMDRQEAGAQQEGEDMELEGMILGEPGMPGGDGEFAARQHEYNGDEWDELDDGLVESLIIVALAGALALLVYARQQRQRQGEEERRRANGQANPPPAAPLAPAQPQAQQPAPRPQAPEPPGQAGLFPAPGDPEFNNWAVGGVGH